jgi:hypothetical protein
MVRFIKVQIEAATSSRHDGFEYPLSRMKLNLAALVPAISFVMSLLLHQLVVNPK